MNRIVVNAAGNPSRQCSFLFELLGVHGTTPWRPPHTKAYAVVVVRVSGAPNEINTFLKALKKEATRVKGCATVGLDGRFDVDSAEKTYIVEMLLPGDFTTPQAFLNGKAARIEDACKKQ